MPPKKTKKSEPAVAVTDNEIADVPARVMQQLRDKNKSKNCIFISDYMKSDPIGGYVRTGSFMLDAAIAYPHGLGLPFPAIVEIVGKECLTGDAQIKLTRMSAEGDGSFHSSKFITVKKLYEKFNNIRHSLETDGVDGRGTKFDRRVSDALYFTASINDEDRIISNQILDVFCSGVKECYEVTTRSGLSIKTSLNHKFYVGDGVFRKLCELKVGDDVYVHNNTHYSVDSYKTRSRRTVHVKHHPNGSRHIIGRRYRYVQVMKSRLVAEAAINGLEFDEYVARLNHGDLFGLTFIPSNIDVHHKDEDPNNNSLENLDLMYDVDHGKLHSTERHNNLRFIAVPDTITSIVCVGSQETYDITMARPFSNYVANKFVVHNSAGKSILLYTIMGNMQRMGGWAQLIDVESSFSADYARLGKMDLSPSRFGYSQTPCLEDGLQIIKDTVNESFALAPNLPLICGYDSVAGSTVIAERDADIGDGGVARALHARILSRALRSDLTGTMYTQVQNRHETVLIPRPLLIVFLNQLKSTCSSIPGQMDSFGGLGLKYHSRVRIQVERIMELKDKDDTSAPPYGIRCAAKIIKNKVASPYRKVEFDIRFKHGIEDYFPTLNFLERHQGIEKSGNYFVWKGRKMYPNAFRDFLVENPQEWEELCGVAVDVMTSAWDDKHSNPGDELLMEDEG